MFSVRDLEFKKDSFPSSCFLSSFLLNQSTLNHTLSRNVRKHHEET